MTSFSLSYSLLIVFAVLLSCLDKNPIELSLTSFFYISEHGEGE